MCVKPRPTRLPGTQRLPQSGWLEPITGRSKGLHPVEVYAIPSDAVLDPCACTPALPLPACQGPCLRRRQAGSSTAPPAAAGGVPIEPAFSPPCLKHPCDHRGGLQLVARIRGTGVALLEGL